MLWLFLNRPLPLYEMQETKFTLRALATQKNAIVIWYNAPNPGY